MSLASQNIAAVSSPLAVAIKKTTKLPFAWRFAPLAALILFCASSVALGARAGDLDISFGQSGKAVTTIPNPVVSRAVALQPDGKIVVAGGPTGINVVRYTKDGQLDPTFGNGGIFFRVLGPSNNFARAVAIQSDGKIVVAGESGINNPDHGILVVRLNADGTLDTTFDGDGIASMEVGSDTEGAALAIQPDGNILVAGSTVIGQTDTVFTVVRFTKDGARDMNFGINGSVITSNGRNSVATSMALLPDGRILLGGTTFISFVGLYGDYDFMMARYNANGTMDNTFGGSGKIVDAITNSEDALNALTLQPDGKIVAAGSVVSDDRDLAIVRYTANGVRDDGFFGVHGLVLVTVTPSEEQANSVAIDPNGNIVAAGSITANGVTRIEIVRCNSVGDLDNQFGVNGRIFFGFGGTSNHAYGMVLQPTFLNGVSTGYKIITTGDSGVDPGKFATARFHGRTGPIDRATVNDFDGDGKSELALFRPTNGNWIIGKVPATGTVTDVTTIHWGASGDKPAPGDYDGDGKYDTAIFRGGTWYVLNSRDNSFFGVQFGLASDIPMPADYDGDGRTDIGVYRPSTGAWYYLRSSDGGFVGTFWGTAGDIPTVGDFDGDDKADLAVYRSGVWYILQSGNGQMRTEFFGLASDKPVAFDYDNDGKTDIGIFRAGDWYYIASSNHGLKFFHWGQSSDIPLPGRYGTATGLAFNHGGQWWILDRDIVWVTGPDGDIPVTTYFAP